MIDFAKHPTYDPSQRPVHVLVVGAGASGIAVVIKLMNMPHLTFEVFEKNHDVGGTWLENRYPGAACDVSSHSYQYTFASNPNWSKHFAPAREIHAYFRTVAEKFGVLRHVQFNSTVTRAKWDGETSKWALDIESTVEKSSKTVVGDVFINAGGFLNDWKWPDIPGMSKYQGKLLHTARWDQSWDWAGKTVGLIGSGATAIQVVPQVQPGVKRLDLFIRSPCYVLERIGHGSLSHEFNRSYSAEEKRNFLEDGKKYLEYRRGLDSSLNGSFDALRKGTKSQEKARSSATDGMKKAIASKELQEKLIPDWEFGCRRITPGRPYLHAVQEPNVTVIRTSIKAFTETGIETSDGMAHEFDAIICATGFNNSFAPRYDIFGIEGRNLRTEWSENLPEAYLSLAASGYPNYFSLLGPNCPIQNGCLIPCIETTIDYIIQVLTKMQREQIASVNVKRHLQNKYNEYTQAVLKGLVWTGGCRSWYKDTKTGKVTAVWAGSGMQYLEVIKHPRWEDFEIVYKHETPFAFLGDGSCESEKLPSRLAFYIDEKSMPVEGFQDFDIIE